MTVSSGGGIEGHEHAQRGRGGQDYQREDRYEGHPRIALANGDRDGGEPQDQDDRGGYVLHRWTLHRAQELNGALADGQAWRALPA